MRESIFPALKILSKEAFLDSPFVLRIEVASLRELTVASGRTQV
jgi:hypothetical protein